MSIDIVKKSKVIELLRLFKSNNRKDFMLILKNDIKNKKIDSETLNEFLRLKNSEVDEDEYLKPAVELDKINDALSFFGKEFSSIKKWFKEVEKKDFTGDPGEPGKDYILTEGDKEEIASKIKPLPPIEKVIERIEFFKEIPIITNVIKEVAVTDEPQVIADKLNTLTEKVEIKVIKGLEDILNKLRHSINLNGQMFMRGGGSSSTGTSQKRDNLTSQCDGSNIIFTLTNNYKSGTVQLWSSQFPIVFDPDTDFTETSANTITLVGIVPEAGQTLVAIYEVQ